MGDATRGKEALIYDPYLDTLGGGERYTLSVARLFADMGYKVDLLWNETGILEKLERRFGISVAGIGVRENFFDEGILRRWQLMRRYDVSFVVSDGSVPLVFARKNFLHFQVPFHGVGGRGILNRLKLARFAAFVCNSNLTKEVIDREYGVSGVVVYPPVAVEEFKAGKKEKLVLSVGRFSQLKQAKRQDVLIEVFRRMVDKGLSGWRLVLAGGSEVGRGDFFERLLKRAKGYPIEIVENPSFSEMKEWYGKARIFWSAAGFGVEEENANPEKLEHFGMAVVEAMAAGAVPIVYFAGGHKEIVRRGESGEGWRTEEELQVETEEVMSKSGVWEKLSNLAKKEALKFSEGRFRMEMKKLFE